MSAGGPEHTFIACPACRQPIRLHLAGVAGHHHPEDVAQSYRALDLHMSYGCATTLAEDPVYAVPRYGAR